MTKLILVEGIPGSGKSTLARRIAERYRAHGRAAALYPEGAAHPADLCYTACFPVEHYNNMLNKNAARRAEIERHTTFDGGYALVEFSQMQEDEALRREWEAFDLYDGARRVPDGVCLELLCHRWTAFADRAAREEGVSVFESALLQAHLNRLMLWSDADDAAIIPQLQQLAATVAALEPVMLYLTQPDAGETVRRVAAERVSPGGDRWIDAVVSYCEGSPYCKRRGLSGQTGAVAFFEARKRLELAALERLGMPYTVVNNPRYDWDAVWADVEAHLPGIGR